MANWCSNTVSFTGNKEATDKILQLFYSMMEQESKRNEGQLPDFIQEKNGFLFEIYQNETDQCSFQYETKWCPNIEVLCGIASHYNAGFVLDYEELGSSLYGRIIYENETITDISLDYEDFDKYNYAEETGSYQFENAIYDSDLDILEILLERKIKATTI